MLAIMKEQKHFILFSGSKGFDYKTRLVGKLPDGENKLEDINIVVPLKKLSKFILIYNQ